MTGSRGFLTLCVLECSHGDEGVKVERGVRCLLFGTEWRSHPGSGQHDKVDKSMFLDLPALYTTAVNTC